jgi:hypothetical protein
VRVFPREWEGPGLLGASELPVTLAEATAPEGTRRFAAARAVDGLALPFAENVRTDVLQVTNVIRGGPASLARLEPFHDFVLGCDDVVFSSVEGFGRYAGSRKGGMMMMYVFNSARRTVRDVPLFVTKRRWGDEEEHEGLGLTLSCGALHRLPPPDGYPRNEWQVASPGRPRSGSDSRRKDTPLRPTSQLGGQVVATAPTGSSSRSRIASMGGTKLEFSPDPVLSPLIGSSSSLPVHSVPGGPEV